MKRCKRKDVRSAFHKSVLLPATALGINLMSPAMAQTGGPQSGEARTATIDEVIVTARRKEESLQDVPISISVFNQQALSERNIVTAGDLAAYTPSLSTNQRFGPDNTSFSIRGFTQELRTTASVGVYFAEVIAPRGGGSITSGDGAGPGAFFDLQNVQVLKGPQGTLFGRNTTGGAVLLVPQKPTYDLEGYVEGTVGDFDLHRAQSVLNVPLGERARARFGVDYQERDGYLKNRSGIGPDRLGNLEYLAGRASLVVDVTDSIENYTIVNYTDSENDGTVSKLFSCNPSSPLIAFCGPQVARLDSDFYSLESNIPDPMSKLEQWQAINTTTWLATDALTVKNIVSYAELEGTLRTGIFGLNWTVPNAIPGIGGLPLVFVNSDQVPGIPTNNQSSFVEELQFQGNAFGNRLTWQGGLYYEHSEPEGISGSQAQNQIYCAARPGVDPAGFNCQDVLRSLAAIANGVPAAFIPAVGNVQTQLGTIEYENKAAYFQATYDISQQFKITGGIRYTDDEAKGVSQQILYNGFPTDAPGAPTTTRCVNTNATLPNCTVNLQQNSNAPTWLADFDYLPSDDVLLYAKYVRGYRQGSVNIFGPQGFNTHGPEEIDSYEIGAKTSFGGAVPGTFTGTFNIAIFDNELRNQQIQAGFRSSTNAATPTTGIVNAGESSSRGVEVETSLRLFEGFTFDLGYTYLDTELKRIDPIVAPPGSPFDTITLTAVVGGPLSQSPEHKAAATATYRLPLPPAAGELSLGATYVYTDDQVTADPVSTPFGTLDSHKLLNLNVNWKGIAGSQVDASLFATNVTDEEYFLYVPGLFISGFETAELGQPRMLGMRLRYHFGE